MIDVRNFGFFVDVSGLAMSGLVPLSAMADDFYVFDPQRNHLVGRRTRRLIRLGDKVEVQVANEPIKAPLHLVGILCSRQGMSTALRRKSV